MIGSLHLAELLCSRICHDLSGLLGSLLGVIEIAREEQAASETLAVAEETAVEMTQRLRLLRAAWGQDSGPLDVAQLQTYADGLFASRRVRLDLFGMAPDAEFPPGAGRLLLNVLLLAAESLPGGGNVALSGSPEGHVLVTVAGPRAAWPAGLLACLTDASADATGTWTDGLTARHLQAPLTALIARHHGIRLSMLMATALMATGGEAALPPLLVTFGQQQEPPPAD
jgi:histidine phosphotransferase ChpT